MQIDVSIIIVNYNTSDMLRECVQSIVRHTNGVTYQIIVVDNASRTEEVEKLRSIESITLIESPENIGFGRANNLGLEYTNSRYILFLNSDTILQNNAIKMLFEYAEGSDKQLGALGCILENRAGELVHSYGNLPKTTDIWQKFVLVPLRKALHCYRAPQTCLPEQDMEVGYITGADIFVPRKVLDQCGAFNPAFFMYYEDTELQYRFAQNGYHNILLRGPRIVHLEGGSNTGKSAFLRDTLLQEKSNLIYFRLILPRWKYLIYRMSYILLRQTLWFNPRVTIRDKWKLMTSL